MDENPFGEEASVAVEATGGSFFELLREFVKTDAEIKHHDDELSSLKKRREHLQGILDMEFLKNNLQNVNVEGKTVYRRKDIRVWKKENVSTSEVCSVLQRVGLGELVHPAYNPQSLAAYVRELDKRDEESERQMPAALQEVVDRVEVNSLIVKSAR